MCRRWRSRRSIRRPRRRPPAEQRDELAALKVRAHSIKRYAVVLSAWLNLEQLALLLRGRADAGIGDGELDELLPLLTLRAAAAGGVRSGAGPRSCKISGTPSQ